MKRSIEDHFDTPSTELVNLLKQGGEKNARFWKKWNGFQSSKFCVHSPKRGPMGTERLY